VENSVDNEQNKTEAREGRDINNVITTFFERFPPFFAEKRYKLIKFAPELEIVDKLPEIFIINEKASTTTVNSEHRDVDNGIGKKTGKKLPTYSRHIILFIPILKKKRKEIKIIM